MPDGRFLALDVVVVQPWASSYAAGASRTNGKAARIAAVRKRTEFATIGEGAGGFDFGSNAAETGGRLGADALRLLSDLGDVTAASNSRLSKAAFVRHALAELACSLCRGNAGVYAGVCLAYCEWRGPPCRCELVAMEEQGACACRR